MRISISEKAPILAKAASLGFADARFTDATLPAETGARLARFVELGMHGAMGWMEARMAQRANPRVLWPEAASALMLALTYDGPEDFAAEIAQGSRGVIAAYARGRDYHDVVKGKLKQLGQFIAAHTGAGVKVFVDTAPVMEKPLAQQAGLGWQGKHTNLVSRQAGSWFFIGCILTQAQFTPDAAETDHCGSCRACLDACPTHAFPAPYQLDARRCISYLTIEHKGSIAREFRAAMGNRIFGCDDCLAACPWNKFAQAAAEQKFAHRELLGLETYLALDDAGFRSLFAGSPVKRTGRDRFVRNCLIAAGNSKDARLLPLIRERLTDVSPLVRAMAVWALARLAPDEFARLKAGAQDPDAEVQAEWDAA